MEESVKRFGSSALPALSNKEKAARAGWGSQYTSTHCVRDDFLGETSLNAFLHWFLGESTQWLSTGSAAEPEIGGIGMNGRHGMIWTKIQVSL